MGRIGDARKQQILAAAAECFARKGFHATTIDDICTTAKVSPGSMYRYFRSKDDIIRAMVDEERRETAVILDALQAEQNLIDALVATISKTIHDYADRQLSAMHAEVTAELLRNDCVAEAVRASDAASLSSFVTLIQQAQHAKQVDRTIDAQAMAELLFALHDGLWRRQAMTPDASPERFIKPITILLQRVLRPN
jgi:TetR/AcrR family transcriptional regulator, repressor for uid operon